MLVRVVSTQPSDLAADTRLRWPPPPPPVSAPFGTPRVQ
ncbi:hypothetical protein GFS60_06648 (plasmid) [Rhodococcus sp. WAY2]|nr:hypothetical protein GFS60_06648 [Rhodococcus sp. WAY2]